jgi:hypothetical protein
MAQRLSQTSSIPTYHGVSAAPRPCRHRLQSIDGATDVIVAELDALVAEVEQMKEKVRANARAAKDSIAGTFILASQASIFAATISARLATTIAEARKP